MLRNRTRCFSWALASLLLTAPLAPTFADTPAAQAALGSVANGAHLQMRWELLRPGRDADGQQQACQA